MTCFSISQLRIHVHLCNLLNTPSSVPPALCIIIIWLLKPKCLSPLLGLHTSSQGMLTGPSLKSLSPRTLINGDLPLPGFLGVVVFPHASFSSLFKPLLPFCSSLPPPPPDGLAFYFLQKQIGTLSPSLHQIYLPAWIYSLSLTSLLLQRMKCPFTSTKGLTSI